MSKQSFSAPRGVPDYLPPQSELLFYIKNTLIETLTKGGYQLVELPIFEHTEVFQRGIGQSTDVVGKEMYTFNDKSDRSITLRPEGTASVMRAIIEHRLDRGPLPVKLFYQGPMFRYENPQSGRLRQFQTVGAEVVGVDDPALDVETIALAYEGFKNLGLKEFVLEINTLGDNESRTNYREALTDFLNKCDLDEPTRERVKLNPMRVLDDKRPEVKQQLVNAPVMNEFMNEETKNHFKQVLSGLDALNIPYQLNSKLVRGLDYYTKTTFEFVHPLLGAQSAIGGGGRYDGLLEQLGGLPLSGIGFGIGIERVMLAIEKENVVLDLQTNIDVYLIPLCVEAKTSLLQQAAALRKKGLKVDMAFGDRGIKPSLKTADRLNARWAIIMGEDEIKENKILVKNLKDGSQELISVNDIVNYF